MTAPAASAIEPPAEPGPLGQAVAAAWSDAILGGLRANAAIPAALWGPNRKVPSDHRCGL